MAINYEILGVQFWQSIKIISLFSLAAFPLINTSALITTSSILQAQQKQVLYLVSSASKYRDSTQSSTSGFDQAPGLMSAEVNARKED